MIFVLLTLILFLLGIFLVLKNVQNGNKKQNLPPGPWGLPLLGHLVSLGLNPHLKLMKWKEKYGPIIHIRFGSFPTVVLCDSKVIKEALSMTEFSGRPPLQVVVETKATNGIGFSEGPYNTELRQLTSRKLKEFGVGRKSLEDQIHEGISQFMDFITMREGLPINSGDFPSSHLLRTLWSIMMTDEMDQEETELMSRPVRECTELGPVLSELAGFMPWMEKIARILSFGRYSLIAPRSRQIKELHHCINKMLKLKEERWVKGQSQSHGGQDMVDAYFEKRQDAEGQGNIRSPFHPSHDSLAPFVADILGAGIHTNLTSLVWTFNYIARNREVQLKLQQEIDQVIGHSRLPSLSDRGQMPYSEAVINESLRMSPVLPLAIPHKTTADLCFHGYTIKKDTMIFANIYGVHHDPEIWGDPENYRPERWLGESGRKLKSEHFLPFGTGRRNCVGDGLAREQLFLYLTTLFQRYNISFSGKTPRSKEFSDWL